MQDVTAMLDTNVKGLIAMTTAIVPHMVKHKAGHVINISSIAGHEAYAGGAIYCATKHAVDAFTTSLRHDLVATQV
jgi:3-hydroxy acid dehydrogenase / malonic semialdehyde reductase